MSGFLPGAQPLQIDELRQLITEDSACWRKRSLISLLDVSAAQIRMALNVAAEMKRHDLRRESSLSWAYPRTLALLFEKPSLRTRVSFEVSMAHLEGSAIYLAPGDVGLGSREAVPDVGAALSRWVDAITARVFSHDTVEELDRSSTIPVINALSDREHPVQAFADLLTLAEHCGPLGPDLKLAYLGDGNNVLHSLLLACASMGVRISAACPPGYEPAGKYVEAASRMAARSGGQVEIVTDPESAVRDANACYTDVWASMGSEHEAAARRAVFAPYQLNEQLMARAHPGAVALHCLPAHRGDEITAEMMERFHTPILDQAENRLHTQKALIVLILGL